MKKLSHFLVALIICLTSVITLSACGKDKVTRATVESGLPIAIARTVENQPLDTKDVVVKAWYESGETKTFTSEDLEFGAFDTRVAGPQDLKITITSEDYSFNYSINVAATEADVNSIMKLQSKLAIKFDANKNLEASSKDAAEMESYPEGFYDTTEPLYVGDDNPFHFDLSVSGMDGMGNRVDNIESVRTIVKVEQWKNEAWTELTGEDLVEMVAVNDINAILNFTDKAVGKKFKVTVTAANPDTTYELNQYSFTQELTVVDGFNVYDVDDMSVFDNFNPGWTDAHNRVKAKYGMTSLDGIRAVVLQRDIELLSPYTETVNEKKGVVTDRTLRSINASDAHKYVRADAFWNGSESDYIETQALTDQVLKGTPYNSSREGIFRRQIVNGQSFSIIGNYFTINASKMPKMVECYGSGVKLDDVNKDNSNEPLVIGDSAQYINSFTTLFYTENAEKDYDEVNEMGTHVNDKNTVVTYRNLAFTGNGAMSQDPRNSGSLSFMKNREVNFYAYNTVTFNFHTTYTLELGKKAGDYDGNGEIEDDEKYEGDGNYKLENCRAYNSYQTFIMLWGAENTTMINCDFRNAGGPGILADSVLLGTREQSDFDKAYYLDATWEGNALVNPNESYVAGPIVNIVDSTIISKATGEEPWYSSVGANTIVGKLAMFDLFFGGSMQTQQGWVTLGYMLGYEYDGSKTKAENDVAAAQLAAAYGYPARNKSIISDYATKTNKDNSQTRVARMDFKAVLGRFQPTEGTMIDNEDQLEGAILTFNTIKDYEKYYGIDCVAEKTTHGLELGREYLAEIVHSMGLPIFESAKNGAFAGAPLADTGVNKNGLVTGSYIASEVFNGVYFGVFKGMAAANIPNNADAATIKYCANQAIATINGSLPDGAKLPDIDTFNSKTNTEKLAIVNNVLDLIALNFQDIPQKVVAYYDEIYAGISAYCPIFNWDKLTGETAPSAKNAALKTALQECFNRGNAELSPLDGKYVNLYLPGMAGYMGILLGSYDRQPNPNQN